MAWYAKKWWDRIDIYTYGVYKFVLTIYYPDGRVEKQGEYKTWYDAYDSMRFCKDIILQGIDAKFEITKERI